MSPSRRLTLYAVTLAASLCLGAAIWTVAASSGHARARARVAKRHQASAREAAAPYPSRAAIAAAVEYLDGRAGRTSLAVVDSDGRLSGIRTREHFQSASVVKVMFLTAFLQRLDGDHRGLSALDESLLYPMIHISDNEAASAVLERVGAGAIARVAREAGMRDYAPGVGWWAYTQTSAADQARFFVELPRLIPPQFWAYARGLLAGIEPEQSWGIPEVARPRWQVFFKTGALPSEGLFNETARLERPGVTFTVSVFSTDDPSMAYGEETMRGVAAALLAGTPPPTPAWSPDRSGGAVAPPATAQRRGAQRWTMTPATQGGKAMSVGSAARSQAQSDRATVGRDRRRRLRRDRRGDRAQAPRHRRPDDPRARAGHRRDVALQQLSRRGLRRAQPPLLVLVRAASRLVAAVLAAGRDPRLPARASRARTTSSATCAADTPSRPARGTSVTRGGLSTRAAASASQADALVLATGQLHQPALPAIEGIDTFAGHSFHSARVGPRLPTRGQARGGRRHGRQRRAVRPGDRRAGRAPDGLPAHRQLVPAAAQPPLSARSSRRRSNDLPGRAGVPAQVHVPLLRARSPRRSATRARSGRSARAALGRVHALAAERPRGAQEGLARLHVRLQARAVQLALPACAAARERRARDRRGRARRAARAS